MRELGPQLVPSADAVKALTNTEIAYGYRAELRRLIEQYILDPSGREWNLAILKSRKADLLYRGMPWVVASPLEAGGVEWKSVNDPAMLRKVFNIGEGQPTPALMDYSLNVVKGDVDKYCAVVGRLIPRDTAVPLGDETVELANRIQTANTMARYLENRLDKEMMPRLAKFLCLYSTSFIYTPYVADEMKYGSTMEPQYELRAEPTPGYYVCEQCSGEVEDSYVEVLGHQCPDCGATLLEDAHVAPGQTYGIVQGEPIKLPNGTVEFYITNNLTTYIPGMATDMDTDPAVVYQYWENLGKLRRIYRDNITEINEKFGTNIKLEEMSGLSTDQSALGQTLALDQVSSPSGVVPWNARRGRGLWRRVWCHPDNYELLNDDGREGELKALLWERFPEGFRLDAPCDVYCNLVNEKLSSVWTACTPEVGDFLTSHNPIFEPYFNAQRLINNLCLIQMQIALAAVPVKLFNSRYLDPQFIANIGRSVRQWIAVKTDGQPFNQVAQTMDPSKPDQIILNFMDWVHNHVRSIVGITDALFGAGNYNTAREAIINREQSMQMLQPVYGLMKRAMSRAKYNAAMLLAKYSGGRLYHAKGLATEPSQMIIDGLQDLLKGGWTYASDEGVPTSPSEQRDIVQNFALNPQLSQMIELDAPDNSEKLLDMVGIPDWHLAKRDMYHAIMAKVKVLLEDMPPPTGYPVASPDVLDPTYAIKTLQNWLVSKEGQQAEEGKPDAFARIIEYKRGFDALAVPPPQAGGPEGTSPQAPPPGAPEPPTGAPQSPTGPLPADGNGLPPMGPAGGSGLPQLPPPPGGVAMPQ